MATQPLIPPISPEKGVGDPDETPKVNYIYIYMDLFHFHLLNVFIKY